LSGLPTKLAKLKEKFKLGLFCASIVRYRVDVNRRRLAGLLWCGGQLEEFRGQLRTDAFILVFEKYIRMIPRLRENSPLPI